MSIFASDWWYFGSSIASLLFFGEPKYPRIQIHSKIKNS